MKILLLALVSVLVVAWVVTVVVWLPIVGKAAVVGVSSLLMGIWVLAFAVSRR